ncbi:MAG TPA: DUF924 family protein [Caulobacteraceae bacterium]|jgi:uncharacterized protein (DUF924 family)
MKPADVVTFWMQAGPKAWFKKSEVFDAQIRQRFEALHFAASRGELDDWGQTPEGALALLLLLDQFPRNLFRGSPHAFATDPLARETARAAIARGFDTRVDAELRQFFYLPFEHSEHIEDQDRSVALCAASGDAHLEKWAKLHRDIIARFGRFPHRNACLGRTTTEEESAFLKGGGFAG